MFCVLNESLKESVAQVQTSAPLRIFNFPLSTSDIRRVSLTAYATTAVAMLDEWNLPRFGFSSIDMQVNELFLATTNRLWLTLDTTPTQDISTLPDS